MLVQKSFATQLLVQKSFATLLNIQIKHNMGIIFQGGLTYWRQMNYFRTPSTSRWFSFSKLSLKQADRNDTLKKTQTKIFVCCLINAIPIIIETFCLVPNYKHDLLNFQLNSDQTCYVSIVQTATFYTHMLCGGHRVKILSGVIHRGRNGDLRGHYGVDMYIPFTAKGYHVSTHPTHMLCGRHHVQISTVIHRGTELGFKRPLQCW